MLRLNQPRSNRDHIARQKDDLLTGAVQDKPSLPGNALDCRLVPNACAFLYADTSPLPGHPGAENHQEFMGRKSLKKRCVTRFHMIYKSVPQARRAKCPIQRMKFAGINAVPVAQGLRRRSPGQVQPNARKNAGSALLYKNSRHFSPDRQKIVRPLHLNSLPKGAQGLCKEVAQHQGPKIIPQARGGRAHHRGQQIARAGKPLPAQLPPARALHRRKHAAPRPKRSLLHQAPRHVHGAPALSAEHNVRFSRRACSARIALGKPQARGLGKGRQSGNIGRPKRVPRRELI